MSDMIFVSKAEIDVGNTGVKYDKYSLHIGERITHRTREGEIVTVIEVIA